MTQKWFWGSAALIAALLLAAALAAGAAAQKKPATAEELLGAALHQEEVEGNLERAIATYKKVVAEAGANRAVAGRALLRMGQCYEKLGSAEARKAYERVVRDYADQAEIVAQARVRLAALGGPGGAGGFVARRVLTDASGVGGVLTADGRYIRGMDLDTGDVVQFEVASGQRSRITNRGPWSETERGSGVFRVFSRDGKQIAYDSYTKDWDNQLRIRNLDGSGLRTLYSEKGYVVHPLDWSPEAGSILARRGNYKAKALELTLISTADGSVRVLRSIGLPRSSLLHETSFSPDGRSVAFSSVGEGSSLWQKSRIGGMALVTH